MFTHQGVKKEMLDSRTVDRAESHINMARLKEHLLYCEIAGFSASVVLSARLRLPGQQMREFLSEVVKETKGILGGNRTALCPDCGGGYKSWNCSPKIQSILLYVIVRNLKNQTHIQRILLVNFDLAFFNILAFLAKKKIRKSRNLLTLQIVFLKKKNYRIQTRLLYISNMFIWI